ncbi:hypothetical protein PsAD2_01085 [Pseudovibrio axinellae]|uniref:Uncharacterized protein n=1 Tax=Pseudovibrio axinellae TaxID=989403 RepID=A0A166A3Y9_9HYPH|nr:hypothetical protein [Pseudovibrio axinellae]KZL20599.1 hypothetical protein PsAD2_01085 [Pseudovibrio axinellae]SER28235.1 hypothetical protein SAMN05421798_107292 [Pseudovibrio axinellae]
MRTGANDIYLERQPERLVLEGYRRWSAGFETGSIAPWEMAWDLYDEALGHHNAGLAIASLSQYVRTLNRCATCPLRSFPYESQRLCVEECLTMGLIAGLQNDTDTAALCLSQIVCPQRCQEVEYAALNFAQTLKCMGQVMLPVPENVLEDIQQKATHKNFH